MRKHPLFLFLILNQILSYVTILLKVKKDMYYTYMLRCSDNSIYTGMTNHLENRIKEHLLKTKNGAKYTKSHDAIQLEAVWKSKDKSLACKLEYHLKTLNKKQKEDLISGEKLVTYLKRKVDCRRYQRVNLKAHEKIG